MKKNGDTKALMAKALRDCMEETPIDKISIKAITDACGLNRQTFYYHFRDIYDLVKWMYVRDINEAIDSTMRVGANKESLRQLLNAFDADRDCHLAIYNSRNYYPNLRQDIINALTVKLTPVFEMEFESFGFDASYREFLLRMYALTIFEFIERRARGTAFSSIDSFVECWFRTVNAQFTGERLVQQAE